MEKTGLRLKNKIIIYERIFSIKEGKEIKKIRLYKEGPNAISGIQGFYIQSDDSVWIYKSWEQELILVNSLSEIIDKKKLKDKLPPIDTQQPYTVSPFPLGTLPISKVGDILILQGMNGPGDEAEPATTILYDLSSDKIRMANPYPEIYRKKKEINERWLTFAYMVPSYTLKGENEMIVSFPASNSLRIYNIKDDSYQHFLAAYSQKTNITPTSPGSSLTERNRKYLEQYQYMGIVYDKYHDLYFRLVLLPTFDYDINEPSSQYKELAIIILNSSFKKVGEYKLDKANYMFWNVFTTKEGLFIKVPSDDDDYLKFITLNIQKNENKD